MRTIIFFQHSFKAAKLALFATILSMGFAACSDNNDPAVDPSDSTDIYEEPPAQPTADAKEVMLTDKTFVFDGGYTNEGLALTGRVTTRAANLQDDDLKNIIIHGNSIAALTNTEAAQILTQMSNGVALVVIDPTSDNMKILANYLHDVIDTYTIGGNNEEARHAVNQVLGSRALDHILSWTDSAIDNLFDNEQNKNDHISLLAFRDEDTFMAFREPHGENDILSVMTYDENGNEVEATTIPFVDDSEMNEYHFGIKADNLADWLNNHDDDALSREASRLLAAQMMSTRGGGTAEEYLDKITESQDYIVPVGFQLAGPSGHNPYHECKVIYRVWTAYSGEKKCDVYCVTQEITAFNQMLHCGPTSESKWYDGSKWSAMDALDSKVKFLSKDVYGPYMKKVTSKLTLQDGNLPVSLEEYVPQNSTTGGQNVQDGFNFSLGSSVSVKSSGPEANVSASMTWTHSVTKFAADLAMKVNASPDANVVWTYTGADPDSHYRPFSNYHETAKTILANTCTLQQAWVWTVEGSTSTSVNLKSSVAIQDNWLTYALGSFECIPYYVSQDNKVVTNISILCPPRHHQTWVMTVKSNDVSADKLGEIEAYLTNKFGQYFMPTCVFSTYKPGHKKVTDVKNCDEIGKYVEKCVEAFNSSTGQEILKEAAQQANMPSTGSFTIVWRQTDLGVNSDQEEYTFKMPN